MTSTCLKDIYSPEPIQSFAFTGSGNAPSTHTPCGSGSFLLWKSLAGIIPRTKEQEKQLYLSSKQTIHLCFINQEEPSENTTVIQNLNFIRDTLGISVSSLANIIGASRTSFYNWLEGDIPNDKYVKRIDELHAITKKWRNVNKHHYPPGRLLKQRLNNGHSMYELLEAEELNREEIKIGMNALLELMDKQRNKMDLIQERDSKRMKDPEARNEILERITGSITEKEH